MGANIVVIGAGPVGLWTAIQTKIRQPEANIVILDKNDGHYSRSHVLKIDRSSLEGVPEHKDFGQVVETLNDGTRKFNFIKTNEIEASLREFAEKIGIIFQKKIFFAGDLTDRDQSYVKLKGIKKEEVIAGFGQLKQKFPKMQYAIGADGARSAFREATMGELQVKQALQYTAQVKFQVQESQLKKGKSDKNSLMSLDVEGIVHQGKGRAKDQAPVSRTAMMFIDQATHHEMVREDRLGTSANPYSRESLNVTVAANPDLQNLSSLKRKTDAILDSVGESKEGASAIQAVKISTIPLEVYSSSRFTTETEKVRCFVVGDAAFGVPFFRALNNGLICGTNLSKVISDSMQEGVDRSDLYERDVQVLVSSEIRTAKIKSAFISIGNFFIRLFALISLSSLRRRLQSSVDSYHQTNLSLPRSAS